ncbi:membrane metallo-endopeptidase-like 1 isoform X2 [Tetranychus urticae]|uniref:membrane metallo-endopeptidase-like 1 isoform X2 n=1 Tax=Tetranychus urticae TaxID=32264 RepID=UPI00077B93C8|nr:membrane metallo-endopeptidase-like 1 isoform X2 [Tetranychus urticae]
MFHWIKKMSFNSPTSSLATQSIKMLYKPHDENGNQLEIEIPKNESTNNRRFNWPRKRFALEIGFYSMTLLATIFLLVIVYTLTRQSINSDHHRCPTVTILRPREESDSLDAKGAHRRTYPDPSDPLYALCGPCPKTPCPECPKQATCPSCPTPPQTIIRPEETSCPTSPIEPTCPPCFASTNQSSFQEHYNETYNETTVTASTMSTFTYTEDYRSENLCLTKNCIIQASDILKMIDTESPTCHSFHSFACHGLISKKSSRYGKNKESQSADDLTNFHGVLTEMTSTNAKEKPIVGEIWNFYQSCLNEDAIERKGKEPLKEVISSMGGWPVLELGSTCTSNYDLTETLIKSHQLGTLNSMLFSFNLNFLSDSSGQDTQINIMISSPSLGMGSIGPYIAKKWGSYYEIMIDTALKLGASKQSALKSMNQVLEFETKIAQIIAREELKNTWTTINLYQMNMIFPSIEWPKYLKIVTGSNLSGDEKINITSVEMLKQINELLLVTDRSTICDFILWRIVLDCLPRLNRFWRQLHMNSIKSNNNDIATRKEICDRQVISYFHNLLPLIYFKEHFDDLELIGFKSMVNQLTDQAINTLPLVLSSNSSNEIVNRIKSMRDYVVDIHKLVSSNAIESMFTELKLSEADYFNNMLELTKFNRKSVMESLKSTDASILRYLFLDNKFLKQIRNNSRNLLTILSKIANWYQALTDLSFLNYSSIGLEILHSFFSSLSQTNVNPSDSQGQLIVSSSLSNLSLTINSNNTNLSCKLLSYNNTTTKATVKRQLIIDYLIYTIVEKSFIADTKGSKESNLYLPGLAFDALQLFYINLEKTLCMKTPFILKEGKLAIDPLKRLDFILNQSETFKGSFGCSLEPNHCDVNTTAIGIQTNENPKASPVRTIL